MVISTSPMRQVVANGFVGEFGWGASTVLTLRLFSNDHVPNVDGLAAAYTESAFGGYAPVSFGPTDNGPPTVAGDDYRVRLNDSAFSWDCTSAPETIYGWYLTNEDGDIVYFAEKYDTPHVLEVGSRHTVIIDLAAGALAG